MRWFGHLKKTRSSRILELKLDWNVEGKRRQGKSWEEWIDGVRKDTINEKIIQGQRFMADQNLFGMKDAYCIMEGSSFTMKVYKTIFFSAACTIPVTYILQNFFPIT